MKSKTKMSWSKLWRRVEVMYDKPESERSEKEIYLVKDVGLCSTVAELTNHQVSLCEIFRVGRIPFSVDWGGHWCSTGGSCDYIRSMFAGFIAAMGYEEFKKMFQHEDVIEDFNKMERYFNII